MKIQATPEGRTNIFIPDADSLIAWIEAQRFKRIHNFIPQGGIMIGADHDVESVIEDIRAAERMAITIGPEWQNNMRHALSIIKNNRLEVYDIGELTEADIVLDKQESK